MVTVDGVYDERAAGHRNAGHIMCEFMILVVR